MNRVTFPLLSLTALLLSACTGTAPSSTTPSNPAASSTPLTAQATTTYYVDSASGLDSNSGTSSSAPWKTLSKVNGRSFVSGDVISFKRGSSFSGTILTLKNAGVTVNAYGSGVKPLFKNPGGLKVLEISAGGVTVDGLAFTDTTTFSNFGGTEYENSGAVRIAQGADSVTVKNSEFYGVGLGIKSYGKFTNISSNYFHDLKIAYRDSGQSYGAVGISLNNSNAEVAYNTFTNCRSTDSPYGADGGAIEIEGLANQKNDIYIHHNTSRNSQGFIEVTETSSSNVTIAYNLSDDYQQFLAFDTTTSPSGYKVENNTVVRTRTDGAINVFATLYYREVVASPSSAWLNVRNNIFYTPAAKVFRGTYSYSDFNYPHSNNLFYDGSSDPTGYGLGSGDVNADPLFVSSSDFHLTGASPAINAGAGLGYTSDLDGKGVPYGGAPDMGAYEYQSAPSSGGSSSNLIGNPGYESSSSLNSPWYTESGGSGVFGVDAGAGKSRSGANNAWIFTSSSNWQAIKQNVSVSANTNYTLSVWIKNSGNFTGGYFGAKTTGGSVLGEATFGAASSYTQYSVSFNSGSNTTVVLHTGYYGPGADSWAQLDDWSLTQ